MFLVMGKKQVNGILKIKNNYFFTTFVSFTFQNYFSCNPKMNYVEEGVKSVERRFNVKIKEKQLHH